MLQVPPYILPAPEGVFVALWSGIAVSPASPLGYYLPLWSTLSNALLGFLIGASLGLVIGSLMAEFRPVETALMPYAFALQSLPKVAIAPLIVIWCGFGDGSKVAMAALLAFFPMLVNSFAGMRSADIERIELMKALSASRLETYRLVKLPSAAPYIFAGLDMGIVYALLGTIVAEFLGAQEGMGVVITKAQAVTDVAGVFAVLDHSRRHRHRVASHRALDPALTDPLGRSRTTLRERKQMINRRKVVQGHRRNGACAWRCRRSCARRSCARSGWRFGIKSVNPIIINILISEQLGYTKEEGLQFTPVALGTNSNAQIAVDKGDVEFAVGTPSFQFPLFAKGQLPPIVNYYEYTYPYKWDVAVKPESGIQKYEDLKGKKIGVSDLGTTDYPVTRAVLQNIGIDPDKDVTWTAVGAGVSAGVALQRGVIDALAYFDTGFGQIDAAGIAMRMLPRPANVPLIGGLFISAMANFLKDNRKICDRLRPRRQQGVGIPAGQSRGRRPRLPQALSRNRAARRQRGRRGQVDPVRREPAHPALPAALPQHQDGLHPRGSS